jgi:lipopolysaccharide transport system permease protein
MHYFELVIHGVYTDLRTEVARRFLGFLWWVIEPVMFMAVFYVVFGLGMRQGGPDYAPFLLCGMVPWKWFDGSVRQAGISIVANANLIQQIFVPKYVFGLVQILSNSFKFLVVLTLLLLLVVLLGRRPSLEWLGLLPLILTQLVFILSVGLLLGALIPFAHDLKQVVDNVLMLMMFLSGIFFSAETLPDSIRPFFDYNPMVVIIESYRSIVLANHWPDWAALAYVLVVAAPMLLVGLFVLRRYDRQYPKFIF